MKQKIIVVLGPTSSGKSELAVEIAKKFNGEIISADSRQVYKNLNIGTGKVAGMWMLGKKRRAFFYKNVPHYCIDYVTPKIAYTVTKFKKCAEAAISDIVSRKKLPIICGGTGFYIDTLVYNRDIPNVKPSSHLRKRLGRLSAKALFEKLKKLDPERAKTIDPHNARRLIRSLEIIMTTKQKLPILKNKNTYNLLWIGIKIKKGKLKKRIHERLMKRMRQGLVSEVKNLLANELSYKRLYNLGLEYRYISLFVKKTITKKEMLEKLEREIMRYAKRQITWFSKDEIHWVKNKNEAMRLTKKFIG